MATNTRRNYLRTETGRYAGAGTDYDRYDEESTPCHNNVATWLAKMPRSHFGCTLPCELEEEWEQ